MNGAGHLETADGAKIYYEEHGEGQPIVLIHGWMCSSQFWRKNVPGLAHEFRVVTLDLRGHGNSSKTLSGHSMAQYARDVRALIEHLDLEETVLVGWSLGGRVVLSYYEQYGSDTRVRALGLVDTAPFPFSAAAWNSHGLRNYNYGGMNAMFAECAADQRKFVTAFAIRMFKQAPTDADREWVVAEMMKTPPWIAEAAYSDFLITDHAKSLPAVRVPVIVFASDSGTYATGIAMGKAVAAQVPQATFVPFEDAGHMLFYEQPQRFNNRLADFVRVLPAACVRHSSV